VALKGTVFTADYKRADSALQSNSGWAAVSSVQVTF